MSHPKFIIITVVIQQIFLITLIECHGRLLEPPARNTLWRFGFKAPPNYNDNELFCGGIGGITRNEGKCGICGDPYDGLRLHETGNAMALNETTRNYFPGSSVDIMIEIVANHGGQFYFEMCWRDSIEIKETEDCFEPLKLSKTIKEDEDELEYILSAEKGTGIYTMSVDLPIDKTCQHCILRWHWKSANNWGVCEDGSEKVGCGYQEVYRNCADVSVKRNGSGIGLKFNRRRKRMTNQSQYK